MGYPRQAWSAAMFLLAEAALRTGELPLFDNLLAAKPAEAVAEEQEEIILHPGGGPE
jgi:Tfp pilus assembly protein PilX